MNYYLIQFKFDILYPEYEISTMTILVRAISFRAAIHKAQENYSNARDFENLTIL